MVVQDRFYILTSILLVFLFSCKCTDSIKKSNTKIKDTIAVLEEQKDEVIEVKQEPFKKENDNLKIIKNEFFKDSLYWKQGGKDYYLKVHLKEKGEFFSQYWVSNLTINFFGKERGKYKKYNSYSDSNSELWSSIIPVNIFLNDANKKEYKIYLTYEDSFDGLDSNLLKIVVFINEKTYISMAWLPKMEDEAESFTKEIDKRLIEYPSVSEYVSTLFDTYYEDFKKEWW